MVNLFFKNSGDDIFSGNVDGTSIVSHDINFKAKAVRIFPANDPSIGDPSVALRVEFYVCPCGPSTEEPSITTATTGKGIYFLVWFAAV